MKNHGFKILLAVVLSVMMASGCADMKDKFIRKPKEEKPIYKKYQAVKTYNVKPSIELYQKRYVFWKSWHRELLDVLPDTNKKKKVTAIEQEISNLFDMQSMLIEEKAEGMQEYIDDLSVIEKQFKRGPITSGQAVRIRRKLETLGRQIKLHYSYTKVGDDIAAEFRSERKAREKEEEAANE